MTATKLFPSGAYEVSDIIGGYLVRRTYYGYSKAESIARFRTEVRTPIARPFYNRRCAS